MTLFYNKSTLSGYLILTPVMLQTKLLYWCSTAVNFCAYNAEN